MGKHMVYPGPDGTVVLPTREGPRTLVKDVTYDVPGPAVADAFTVGLVRHEDGNQSGDAVPLPKPEPIEPEPAFATPEPDEEPA